MKRTSLFLMCSLAAAACARGGVDGGQDRVDPPAAQARLDRGAVAPGAAAISGPAELEDDPDEGGQIASISGPAELEDDPDEGGQIAAVDDGPAELEDDPDEGGQSAARHEGRGGPN